MNNPNFMEVYPDAVVRAGQATADTAGHWRTWGTRIRTTLDYAETGLRNEVIFEQLKIYAGSVVAGATRVGQQVENLGIDASSAGTVVAGADADSEATLHQPGGVVAGQGTALSRPVNH